MKKRIVWLLCVALVLCLSLPSWADESVVRFAGEAEKFVYLPEDGDLFTDFKGVMPGDVRTQTVVVTTRTPKRWTSTCRRRAQAKRTKRSFPR